MQPREMRQHYCLHLTCRSLSCTLIYLNIFFGPIDIQLSVNPVVARLSPEEKELLRKDVTNEVLKWTSDDVFPARPTVYLVHARKRQE